MSTNGEAFLAKMADNLTAGERAARVKEFITDSDPEIIADLFEMIRDAVIKHETDIAFMITEHYRSVNSILNDVMTWLCI